MTYTRMVELLASKTGYPKKMVQHILDAQCDIIKNCMINQEEVHFSRVLKLRSERQKFSWRGTVGEGDGERIVLRVRPVRSFRTELSKWTEDTMDKFGVVTDNEESKIASKEGRPCPECGSKSVDYAGSTPHCPHCGTRPWEPNGNGKDFRR